MRLSRRLLLLILLCLLPMVAAALVTLADLRRERTGEVAALARRRVAAADADLLTVLDGARAVLLMLTQVPAGPDCPARLEVLSRALPAYRFLALAERSAGDGTLRGFCASRPDLGPLPPVGTGWLAGLPTDPGFHLGRYAVVGQARDPRAVGAFLPVAMRTRMPDGADRLVFAALDLHWLGQHLAAVGADLDAPAPEGALTLMDRDGVVLARVPGSDSYTGVPVSPEVKARMHEAEGAVFPAPGLDHQPRLVAIGPAGVLPDGLSVAVGVDPAPFAVGPQDMIVRSAVLGLLATVIALFIAWAAGRRAIQRPAARLLAAVARWRAGDFSARADMRGDRSEFGLLGEAFNQMAADIEARDAAHALQAQLLEAQVAERTRELSGTNNRLQVEIAERQRAETVLHQAQKLQAVGQLAGGVAHDFNNLLATILGSIELIERRVVGADDKLRALLTRAIDAVQRGSQLTSRLLAFSRRQRLAARPTDINRLVADLVTLATSTLGRRIRIQTDLAPDLWPAMADASQLEAALLNLALNARDAMPQGGVLTLTTGNETVPDGAAEAEPGDYVCITVTDTGVGMSRETLTRAFEPFFTTKELGKGSGLGLSQVYGLARQSGGAVRIQSGVGKGTVVSLLMPRAAVAAETMREALPAARRSLRPVADLVLLVDDDADVRHVSVEMLRDLGYDVVEASDGEEALATVGRLPRAPALLVLDYAMPGMNGLRLAAALRARGLTAPLVLATGYAELTDDASGIRPEAILHKPFSLAELERTLERLRVEAA